MKRGLKTCIHEYITRDFRYSYLVIDIIQLQLIWIIQKLLENIMQKVECQTDQQKKAVMHGF